MGTNIDINEMNYGSQRLYNTYHSDLADLRIENGTSNEKVFLRDKAFKELESINSQNKEEVFKRVGENRIGIDVFSNEYEQVANAEYVIKQLDKRLDLDKYDISLTNSELSQSNNNVSVQLHGGLNREQNTFYSISSNELKNNLNAELNEYHYEEEKSINTKLESINVLAETLDRDINTHIESSIQNNLIENGSGDVFKEIRNSREEIQNKLNDFENYFENNRSEIIKENNFEEGYNSRTGSTESLSTLLSEYKLDNENKILENGYNNLSNEARHELDKLEKLTDDSAGANLSFSEFPEVDNALNRLDKELNNLTDNGNIYKNFEVITNDITKSFDVIGKLDNDNYNVATVDNKKPYYNYNVNESIIQSARKSNLTVAEHLNNHDNLIAEKLGYLSENNGSNSYLELKDRPLTIDEISHTKMNKIDNYHINFSIDNKKFEYTIASSKPPKEFINSIESNNTTKDVLKSDLKYNILNQNPEKTLNNTKLTQTNEMQDYQEFKKQHMRNQEQGQSL